MRYLIILVLIIGLVTYIFLGGAQIFSKNPEVAVDRRAAVWDQIAQLEHRRRDMLIRAQMGLGGHQDGTTSRLAQRAGYAAGYRSGFDRGYVNGSYLAENREPNPLFFPIPNP